ncbi:NAD-P-binding protein [Roridomyces roridus]|uniref:NAD-P-binding protein n=1 Tax=Roridomyces roridus TaxID=1738132 RepID=A0AAD7B6Y9_9AGAR|nr:NAD-P-binding protein [Roridomyces roridus]
MSTNDKKIILVIGATGAQGKAVVDALLAPTADGNASPYAVRALTRDPNSKHALQLAEQGVECVKGSFEDMDSVAGAMEGAYGAWVNTDGFTVGEVVEMYSGVRIFETAKGIKSLRHYVWSSLPYVSKLTGYNPEYKVDHMDAKARVAEFLRSQPSQVSDSALSWSIVSTGPYMELLMGGLFDPLNVRKDSTVVFAAPIEDGQPPMIALKDLGWWARYTFDHREETSSKELHVTSERVGWEYLVETFTKVTGKPAVYKRQTMDEWWTNFDEGINHPVASDKKVGDGSRTIRGNFSAFWRILRDDVIVGQKDMEWIKKVHPETYTLERWMRENNYTGRMGSALKNAQEGRTWGLNHEVTAQL